MRPDPTRRTVLAAIDASPAADRVLRIATALSWTLQAPVRAVHVTAGRPDPHAQQAADRAEVALRVVDDLPIPGLIRAVGEPEVGVAVVGCRDRPGGPRPAGHVALALIEHAAKPVVVVPAEARTDAIRKLTRVLVPLDGTTETAAAVQPAIELLAGSGLQVVVLHVFDLEHVPAFLDQPRHALDAWGHEFLARYADTDLALVLRGGAPGRRVLDVVADEGVDLVVLGWSQDLSPGRAEVIHELLDRSPVPLLLVPLVPEHAAT